MVTSLYTNENEIHILDLILILILDRTLLCNDIRITTGITFL